MNWSTKRAIVEAVATLNVENLHAAKVPAPVGSSTTKNERSENKDIQLTSTYLSRQGSLNWIGQLGRIDCLTPISQAGSVMTSRKPSHIAKQSQIISYLNRTSDTTLTWDTNNHLTKANQLTYYSDGSYIGESLDSRMGYVGVLNGGAVVSESKLTKFQCSGVFDVEEAAAALAAKDLIYRRQFLIEFGYPQEQTTLFCDNAATIQFTEKQLITSLNKHIMARGAYTRSLQA
ncbi:MAG: hypothetical protein COB29_01245 [Sulfitobacter sp.]|nr:MAG: hypothetical protein COB29_01245 [Sulfitobacter sp.]